MNALPDFRVFRPASAGEAVRLNAQHAASRFIAGGTDLLPNIRRGLVAPAVLIDLGGVADMAMIAESAAGLRIGAGVTLAKVASDPRVVARLPALAQAALAVAGPTHRQSATLGGNLCLDTRCRYYNQSEFWRDSIHHCLKLDGDTCRVAVKSKRCYAAFSGDVAPALIALGAEVEVLGEQGARRLAIADLYADDGMVWLTLKPGELLVAVHVPFDDAWSSAYEKMRIRGSIDFPLAGVAVALRREGAHIAGLRIACTGVASRPFAVDGLDALVGKPFDATAQAGIAECVDLANRSMKTTLVDALFRRNVTPVLARRLVQGLWNGVA
jgi:4-hydroxybenzoyl-CoA reductase subunit beta